MSTHLQMATRVADKGHLGPAMRALPSDRMRAFVQALLDYGSNDYTHAARVAGYADAGGKHAGIKVTAHRLAHDERVQAAMHEEAIRRMNAGKIMAVSVLHNIANNPAHKDQLKATLALLDRTGLHATSEHKVTVDHGEDKEVLARINASMAALGLDEAQRKKMLGQYGIVDLPFTVVEPKQVEYAETIQPEKEEWET